MVEGFSRGRTLNVELAIGCLYRQELLKTLETSGWLFYVLACMQVHTDIYMLLIQILEDFS